MTAIYPPPITPEGNWPETVPLMGARLIACNHCGIVALDTPAFGWRRFYDDDANLAHHCGAAVYEQDLIRQGLVHLRAPDEAVVYENPDNWVSELVGAHGD